MISKIAELDGIRDEQWPAWYADYLLTNGLSGLTSVDIEIDQLTEILEVSAEEFKAENGKETWTEYTARKLLESFS